MIKRIIGKVMARTLTKTKRLGQRVEVPLSVHGVDAELLDHRALEVVRTLKKAGYEAYVVGGAVRDLVLGVRPKDFDVATNATPEQVKTLFRRAFIIGRRFRIVHVIFGRGRDHEVIEVSTFRALVDHSQAKKVDGNEKTAKNALAHVSHAVDAQGRVLRDNVWGSLQEDAARRDFSINSMYYDPERELIIDYHRGFEDCQKRVLRLIGDPEERYREDPVRMLRAVRFLAKLEKLKFKLEPKTLAPIHKCKTLLMDIPQGRMFDETIKLLQTGHAQSSLEQLRQLGVVGQGQGVYPLLDLIAARADVPLVAAALRDTDRRIQEGKSAAPYFLLACVLWDEVRGAWQQACDAGAHTIPALSEAVNEVFERRVGDVSGRGKLAADMREVWMMQPRFEHRTPAGAVRLLENFRYRAAYDFYRLRAAVGEADLEIADWWDAFAAAEDADAQASLFAILPKPSKRKVAAKKAGNDLPLAEGEQATEGTSGVAKKRRRRKKSNSKKTDTGLPSEGSDA